MFCSVSCAPRGACTLLVAHTLLDCVVRDIGTHCHLSVRLWKGYSFGRDASKGDGNGWERDSDVVGRIPIQTCEVAP